MYDLYGMFIIPGRWPAATWQPLDLRLRAGVARAVAEALAQRVSADPHRTLGRRTTLGAHRTRSHLLRPAYRSPYSPTRPQPGGPGLSRQRSQQCCLLAAPAATTLGCPAGVYHQEVIVGNLYTATFSDPRTGRCTPLLDLNPEVLGCHASALSSAVYWRQPQQLLWAVLLGYIIHRW